MKKFLILIFSIFCILGTAGSINAEELRVPKGTFFRVINIRELYTPILDEGDTVGFLLSQPHYIRDYMIFPQNSIMLGYISKINEPVEGINASMAININKVVTPSGEEFPLKGTIISGGNRFLGGDLAPVKLYNSTPHYIKGLGGGVLQLTPTNYRYYGENLKVKAGTELFVELSDDFVFTPKE